MSQSMTKTKGKFHKTKTNSCPSSKTYNKVLGWLAVGTANFEECGQHNLDHQQKINKHTPTQAGSLSHKFILLTQSMSEYFHILGF